MANARGQSVDRTCLSLDGQEATQLGLVHRDYLAHCLRWTHVQKRLHTSEKEKRRRVLDVGCGVELPLLRNCWQSRNQQLAGYVGVDANPLALPAWHTREKFPVTLLGKTDAAVVSLPPGPYDLVVCLEVVEHVEPAHGRALLVRFGQLLDQAGPASRLILSTPCYDARVGAAANHVSEITFNALGATLEDLGFQVHGVWGTFASQRDLKAVMTPAELDVYDRLAAYYHPDYLATTLAPLYPGASRNALWELGRRTDVATPRRFPPLARVVVTPWTSSARWRELAGA